MSGERISTFSVGDTVRTHGPVFDIAKPFLLRAGALGRLAKLQRVQGGLEVWSMWVFDEEGFGVWGVVHMQIELCHGPLGRFSIPAYRMSLLGADVGLTGF